MTEELKDAEREAFEAWVAEYRKGKPYWSKAREEILWDGWQASRRATLEEAAQVAYSHNAIMATTTAQLIENAIRELAKDKP